MFLKLHHYSFVKINGNCLVNQISYPKPYLYGKMNPHLRTTFINNALSIRIVAVFLLIAYCSVFLISPGILPHHDHDHVEHGIDTCRKDPCHISIYHHGNAGACNHKYHFTQASEKCLWCDVILAYQVISIHGELCSHDIVFSSVESDLVRTAHLIIPFCYSGRGPPSNIIG